MNKIRRHKIKKEFKDVDKPKASTAAASAAVKMDKYSEEKDLTYYLHDRVELMHQIFSMLKPKELMAMAPDCIRNLKIDDLQELCLEEVLGISSKRLCAILDGAEPPSDTETSSSDESIQPKPALDQLETISLDSISSDEVEDEDDHKSLSSKGSRRKKHSHAKKHKHTPPHQHTHQPSSQPRVKDKPSISESSQAVDNTGDSKAAERAGMTVLELLELQARARAIRAQLALENTTKDEKTTTNKTVPSAKKLEKSASSSSESEDSSHHSSICIKEEPAEVLEVPGSSSEDEKTVLREQRERGKKTSGTASTSTAAGSSSASTSQPPKKSDLTIIVPQTHSRKIKLKRNKVVVQVTNVVPEKKSLAHSKSDNKDRMPKPVKIVENVEAKKISNKTDEVIKIKDVENDKMEAKSKDEVKPKETKITDQSDKTDKSKRSRTKQSRNYRSCASREGSDHDEITLQLSDTEKMDLLENFDPKNYENVSSSSSNVESDEESPLKNNSNTQIQIDENEGTSDKKEASNDNKEATHTKKEATHDKKEATNDEKEATCNKKEATNDKKETTYNKQEATNDKKEATIDKKEVTNNEKEATYDKKEATNDKKEATNDKKEATNDKKEATNDKKEATNDKKEAAYHQKQATNDKNEAINDNTEIVNLEKTVESNKQNLDVDITGDPENTSESQVKEAFLIESNTEETNSEKVSTNSTDEHTKNTHDCNNHNEIQLEDKDLKESDKSTEITNGKNEDVNTETENNSEMNHEKIILSEEKTENDKIEVPAERKSEINKEELKENKEESEKEKVQLKADTKSDGEISEKSSSDIEMLEKPPEIICISDEEVKEAAKKSKKNKKEKKAKKKSKKHSKKSGFCKAADRDSSVQRKNEEDLSATDNIVILIDTEETNVSKRVVIEETNEETSIEIEQSENERRKSITKETTIEVESEKSDDLEEDVYEVNYEIYEISDESSGSEGDFKILSKEPTSEEIEELSQRIDTEIEREEIISEDQMRTSNVQIETGAMEGSKRDTNSMMEESGKNDTEDFEEELSWKHRWLESKKVQKIMVTSNIFNAIRKKNKELKLKLAQKKNETELPMVESERIETTAAENEVVEVSEVIEGAVEENAVVEGSIEHYNMLEGSTKYVDPVADTNATELDKSMRKDAKQLMRMYKKLVKAHSDSNKSESERKAKKERKKARREKRKALPVKNVEETPLNES